MVAPRSPKGSDAYYVRDPAVSIVSKRGSVLFIRPDGTAVTIETNVAMLVRALESLITPNDASIARKFVGDSSLDLLVRERILLKGTAADLRARMPPPPLASPPLGRVVAALCGSIGVVTVAPILVELSRELCREIDVVITAAAARFVRPKPIESLGFRAWTDTFGPRGGVNVPHMHLAESADMVIVLAASAHTIHKLASGSCCDLLALVVTATRAPVVVVPSMNRTMWEHPAVARNVATLRDDGIYVVEPSVGFAASDGRRACEPGGVAMGLGAGAAQVFTAIHQVARTKQRPSNGVSRRGVKQQADV